MKSDPDHRLVTGELERRRETNLRELKIAEEQYERDQRHTPEYAIPAHLFAMLKDVGARLPEAWDSGLLRTSQMRALLRSLIDKVVIHCIADRAGTEGDFKRIPGTWRSLRISNARNSMLSHRCLLVYVF